MKIHPAAEVFPAMTADEYERLADDIEANGLLEPITLLDGAILDGRHRYRACQERGIEPRFVDWDAEGITPLEWVISKNLHRRQLTNGQKAALAAEYEPQLAAAALERKRQGNTEGGRTAGRGRPLDRSRHQSDATYSGFRKDELAGKAFGVSRNLVAGAKAVKREDPKVFEELKAGTHNVNEAKRRVGLNPTSGPNGPLARNSKTQLREVLVPMQRYLKNWTPKRLDSVRPKEAAQLLKLVQEIDRGLLEIERVLDDRTVVSRALS